ncbi:hypothetical protein DEAC_c05330 [Desulfosporosinus acididurans]|uniref:Uncharacterized protein n=1 Tax=Desulfosporosinus acididurans TaxID=476652 RepID=A0A0J1IRL3_9FIRM|nr:hypothetical protein [Desulfosporosinus acididurans]KLU67321.1 hypothetical protein DEAC_c05330 [Desulfosporosinus acididurans]
MITPLPSSILLNFNEADTELWQDLQQIEPDLRNDFIKEALCMMFKCCHAAKRFLPQSAMMRSGDVLQRSESHGIHEHYDSKGIEEDYSQVDSQVDSFSLEALFTEGTVLSRSENQSKSSLGYQHLMNNVIGLEDDEEVLKVLQDLSNHKTK